LTFIHHIRLQRYKGQKEIFALFWRSGSSLWRSDTGPDPKSEKETRKAGQGQWQKRRLSGSIHCLYACCICTLSPLQGLFFFHFSFIIHMCIQGLVYFSPLPPPPPLPPTPPPPAPPLNTQQKLFCPYL
jgi:hypothetical protein